LIRFTRLWIASLHPSRLFGLAVLTLGGFVCGVLFWAADAREPVTRRL